MGFWGWALPLNDARRHLTVTSYINLRPREENENDRGIGKEEDAQELWSIEDKGMGLLLLGLTLVLSYLDQQV